MSSQFKNITKVSVATILSRIFGFFRDIIFFSFCGYGGIGSAFLLAFTLPNLFRKLLGEGALSSAIIPVLAGEMRQNGKQSVFSLLNRVMLRLIIASSAIAAVIMIILACALIVDTDLPERWLYGIKFSIILMPYMVLICLSAVAAATLNVLDKFLIPAITSIWLNFTMILAMYIGGFFLKLPLDSMITLLCYFVILGGIIQLGIPLWQLFLHGWRPTFFEKNDKALKDILRLFWPGLFGASISQTNIILSRTIAFWFSESAVSILYLASRVIDLPLGVFSSAITTVFFPNMSRAASEGDGSGHLKTIFSNGLFFVSWILVPAAVGMFVLRAEILIVFFEWGNFGKFAVNDTIPIIGIFCISLPFYGLAAFFTRAFHSLKDTISPVIIGFISFTVNIVLTITLMKIFGISGIATANTAAVMIQTILLKIYIAKKNSQMQVSNCVSHYYKIFLGSAAISFVVTATKCSISAFSLSNKLSAIAITCISVPISIVLYLFLTFGALKSCKHKDL